MLPASVRHSRWISSELIRDRWIRVGSPASTHSSLIHIKALFKIAQQKCSQSCSFANQSKFETEAAILLLKLFSISLFAGPFAYKRMSCDTYRLRVSRPLHTISTLLNIEFRERRVGSSVRFALRSLRALPQCHWMNIFVLLSYEKAVRERQEMKRSFQSGACVPRAVAGQSIYSHLISLSYGA